MATNEMLSSVLSACISGDNNSHCVFCSQSSSAPPSLDQLKTLVTFTTFWKRYVRQELSCDPTDTKVCALFGVCSSCGKTVAEFCEIYHKLQVLELQLEWKLGTLLSSMKKCSKTRRTMPVVRNFREEMIEKSGHKLSITTPRVKVKPSYSSSPSSPNKKPVRIEKPKRVQSARSSASSDIPIKTEAEEVHLMFSDIDDDGGGGFGDDHHFADDDHFAETFPGIEEPPLIPTVRNEDGSFSCGISECQEVFSTEEQLRNHHSFHGQFTCNFCDLETNWSPNLALHEAQEHAIVQEGEGGGLSVRYKCPRCSFTSNYQPRYTRHFLQAHLGLDVPPTICPICQLSFTSPANLKIHIRDNHHQEEGEDQDNNEQIFRCPDCPAYFTKAKTFFMHQSQVHQEQSKTCHICTKVFKRPQNLRDHLRLVHPEEDPSRHYPYGCKVPHCKKRFLTKSHRDLHQKACQKYEKKEVWDCPQCPKKFKNKPCLTAHLHGVHAERKFICEECGKAFKTRNLVNTHKLYKHLGPDHWEHQCADCGKKFANPHKLEVHQVVHTGVKAFECAECGEAFTYAYQRKNHMRHKHSNFSAQPKAENKLDD